MQPQPCASTQHHPAPRGMSTQGCPSQGEGKPEQCQDLRVSPPRLCHSRLDRLLLFTAQGLDAPRPGGCWALPLPLQILWACSPGGACPWGRVLPGGTSNHTQTDGKAGRDSLASPRVAAVESGCAASALLLPPGKTRAGPGRFQIQHSLRTGCRNRKVSTPSSALDLLGTEEQDEPPVCHRLMVTPKMLTPATASAQRKSAAQHRQLRSATHRQPRSGQTWSESTAQSKPAAKKPKPSARAS